MCFGKKDHYDPSAEAAKPVNYPPPQPTYASPPQDSKMSNSAPQHDYAPPPGPPPSQQHQAPMAFASELDASNDVAAPPGPPPSKKQDHHNDDYAAPPPGPPPGHLAEAGSSSGGGKKQHDWESVVPDTSLFPPPPDIFTSWDRSPANNASEEEANAGFEWCRQHPLRPPVPLDPGALEALHAHNLRLMEPPGYRGRLDWVSPGVWRAATAPQSRDTTILGYPPLYSVAAHSPLASGRRKTVYYEVHIQGDSRPNETSLAIGYAALPYPAFRLPGWHRGSLAVHGDDGHKYINDAWGGRSFAEPFRRGDKIGLGMHFTPNQGKIEVDIFLTRNGAVEDHWDLHEETDAQQELPVTGLEGFHDLAPAIGTFDMVSFEVVFEPSRWAYRGVVVD